MIKQLANMQSLSIENNRIFIAGQNVIGEWEQSKILQKLKSVIKNYLELDNVSFLFGAGTSINLGSISITSVPKKFEDGIESIPHHEDDAIYGPHYEFLELIKKLQKKDTVDRLAGSGNINYSVEQLLNVLTAIDYLQEISNGIAGQVYTKEIIAKLKEEIFKICDLALLPNNTTGLQPDEIAALDTNKFTYHEKFAKKILQRPLNLKRVNIFTTNYDLAFDTAFDRLGVHYINGFSGFHTRTFRPETYDYDLFFPGSTTHGKVTRIEKVLKYYKIHGSLTWVQTTPAGDNVYGIEEWPIELVRKKNDFSKLMIYPSAAKKAYTLDFPYSELFRQFAATITQQQSVLVTFGYSFSDEHINDIIYQALTIPSFTLVIIDFKGTANAEIDRLNKLKDPRIIIVEGTQLGSWPFFVEQILPDFIEENIHDKVAETLRNLYVGKTKDVTEDMTIPVQPTVNETFTPPETKDDLPF